MAKRMVKRTGDDGSGKEMIIKQNDAKNLPFLWIFSIVLAGMIIYSFVFHPSFLYAQEQRISYEELKQKYVPQASPEATYRLELEMMSQGMYCYGLPIFDPQWRNRGNQILYSSAYKDVQKWSTGFEVYTEGDYAVIYYPRDKSCGPVFLYRDSSGWVLDRTAVINNIHYAPDNSSWLAYEGNYPYLDILKKIFKLKKGHVGGIQAYTIE